MIIFTVMKHRVAGKKFSRNTKERKALFLSLVRSLVERGVLVTTLTKAKTTKRLTEKLVTSGKKNSVAGRREVFSFLRDKKLANYLVDEIVPLFKQRSGGYLRLIHLPPRKGDAAPMAKVEWVELLPKKEVKKEVKSLAKKDSDSKVEKTEPVGKEKEPEKTKKTVKEIKEKKG